MPVAAVTRTTVLETLSGLEPWVRADLPVPPTTCARLGGRRWPGVIAIFLQAIFNTEVMRYTLATGEPVVHGLHAHASLVDSLGVVVRRAWLWWLYGFFITFSLRSLWSG